MVGRMVPAKVEKDILIEAPIELVWRVVSEPDHIKEWFSEDAQIDRRAGGVGSVSFPSGETYYLQVEAFDPPHRFAYRWLHAEGTKALPENSTLVEFTLQSEGGGTRLRVVESGFDKIDWTDDAKVKSVDDHSRGWQAFLERLRDYAPEANATARG